MTLSLQYLSNFYSCIYSQLILLVVSELFLLPVVSVVNCLIDFVASFFWSGLAGCLEKPMSHASIRGCLAGCLEDKPMSNGTIRGCSPCHMLPSGAAAQVTCYHQGLQSYINKHVQECSITSCLVCCLCLCLL